MQFCDDRKKIRRILLSGLFVLAISIGIVLLMDLGMRHFLDVEQTAVREAMRLAEQAKQEAAKSNDERLKLKAKILQAQQMEAFYNQYKSQPCYQYYGQYYELYEHYYEADVIFLGTSHATHGINPQFVEKKNPNYSFFNFAINGAPPSYYLSWYDLMKNEAKYPTPKVIVYAVDWFMFDSEWLWRRFENDLGETDCIGVMRALQRSKQNQSTGDGQTSSGDGNEDNQKDQATAVERTSVFKLIAQSAWWDIDNVTTIVLRNTPIFSARDRIPQMVAYYFGDHSILKTSESLVEPTPDEDGDTELTIPTYQHEYLVAQDGTITSQYYKGFIPREQEFEGGNMWRECNFDEKEVAAFRKLIEMFLADGIKVIFVETPDYNGTHAQSMEKNNAVIQQIADEYSIPFKNYNNGKYTHISGKAKYYFDWGHLNSQGSKVFSELLGRNLVSLLAQVTGTTDAE